jgi:ATP-dependent Clp protease ATP-binding subunit ClpB
MSIGCTSWLRPRRYLQRVVETKIGRALLAGDITEGATITLDAHDDELVVT